MPTILSLLFSLVFSLVFSLKIFAAQYSYEVGEATSSTVTQESFLRHFYGVIALYQKEFGNLKDPVIPIPEWHNPHLTAYTARVDNVIKLGFWGGMARIPGMNDDAVALITCHEVGHILGGHPYITIDHPMYDEISIEGQSDYFATKECLKNYFSQDRDTLNILTKEGEESHRELCRAHSHETWQEAICLRTLNGLKGFKNVVHLLKKDEGSFNISFSNLPPVNETITNSYPSNQCRMETFLAGLFDRPRPTCWYQE